MSRWRAQHWDDIYRERGAEQVSWYQPDAAMSLRLIDALDIARDAAVIDVGAGASRLVDGLLERGFTDVSVLDISAEALADARGRVGPDAPVRWLRADILDWRPPRRFALWHDRAVFHFLTEADARSRYLAALRAALEPGGGVVLATFAPDGPDRCSGLPVARYSAAALAEQLGGGFAVVASDREEHVTPRGAVQPFTWIAAERVTGTGSREL